MKTKTPEAAGWVSVQPIIFANCLLLHCPLYSGMPQRTIFLPNSFPLFFPKQISQKPISARQGVILGFRLGLLLELRVPADSNHWRDCSLMVFADLWFSPGHQSMHHWLLRAARSSVESREIWMLVSNPAGGIFTLTKKVFCYEYATFWKLALWGARSTGTRPSSYL